MRLTLVATLLLVGVAAADVLGGDFPYTATVVTSSAQFHSGPGDDYYATNRLPEGTSVEVYKETDEGWLAIRPPAGSYSWVFSRHVDVIGDGVGRINKDDVASRIGSTESEKREIIQVRLREDERVAIVEPADGEDGLWCKIEPPAGEFRWIRADDVELDRRPLIAAQPPSTTQLPAVTEATVVAAAPTHVEPTPVDQPQPLDQPQQLDSGWQVTATPAAPVTTTTYDAEPPLQEPRELEPAESAVPIAEAAPPQTDGDGWTQKTSAPVSDIALASNDAEPMLNETASIAAAQPSAVPPTAVSPVEPPPMEVPQNDSGWNATVRPVAHNEPPQPTTSAARAPTATAQQPLTPPPILSYPPPPQRYAEDPRFKSPGRVPAAETLPPTTNRPAATATAMPLQSTTAPPAVACNPPATGNAAALPANAPTGEPTADGRQFSPEFVKQLTSLDIRLSQTVTTDRSEWQLDLLENEAEALRGEAQTVSEREAAKHVLSKIDRFANIQRRFERVATAAPPVATNPQPMMPVGPPPVAGPPIAYGGLPSGPLPPIDAPPGIQAVSPVPPLPEIPLAYGNNRRPIRPLLRTKPPETGSRRRFDAVGVLRPVRARRPGIPDYALVDDAGQVVTFVTPTPDIDPQPFVGQRVGISGPREYLQDLQKNHVTAGRISPVGDSFRR